MYEFTSHHLLRDTQLETTLRSAFDRIADAPNASPATYGLTHADGGLRTFTARFERYDDARTFRAALASDPEADANVTPRLEELEPDAPPRVSLDWSEEAPGPAAS